MYKICPTCKIEKLRSEFNLNKNTRDGLQTRCRFCELAKRKYVEVKCSTCGDVKKRRTYQLKHWKGNCRSCAQTIELSKPHRKEISSKSGKLFTAKFGGIPNAKKFTSEDVRGSANHNWKGGVTTENQKGRGSKKATEWRHSVFVRDSFTCQLCGQIGGNLQAHHKKEWANFKSLRYDVDNGATLCKTCHKDKAHRGAWRNIPTEWQFLTNA